MKLRDLLRGRLAFRIYLVGLAQFAVVTAGFIALLIANRPTTGRPPIEGPARFAAAHLERALGDRAALDDELRRIQENLGASVTVIDPAGVVVAATSPPAPRCADLHDKEGPPEGGPGHRRCITTPLRFPDGRAGQVEFAVPPMHPPPPPLGTQIIPIVLLVVGVSSLLLARSLTGPLGKMSRAARALGGGDLRARVAVRRRDELGEVAQAFDEMAERLTELLRAEKELLANISHELRTPLARIRVALDIAAEGDAETARESLADITGDLDELERLITDVLTAARLELGDGTSPSGIPPLRRQRIDVKDLIAQAASRFRSAHPDRALRVEVAEALPAVDGDPVLLRRVVDNLLENAHKYTEKKADPIDLVARADGGVTIDVVDKGIGIAAEDLPRVFRPFFRADKSRTRATGGLGLGLALTKRIVDAHGGSIELESAPDQGTRARVRLPADPETPESLDVS